MNKSIVPASKQLVKLIKRNPNTVFVPSANAGVRFLHIQNKTPGFFDQVSGIYSTPGFKLSMKPLEFRGGQPLWYTNFLGGIIIAIPVAAGIFFSLFSLFWYTFFDSQTTLSRSNPHPFLMVKNGADSQASVNPLFRFCYPFGPQASDFKTLFQNELNRAKNKQI
ncbi:hypothetical protein C9374_001109 [Naegleria lovaniensis]|uniref:Uncharacterized protein n=1 Tax=Naegleria lovaniensis TaxID=51637 RepID=A0AA88G6H6_NAELO|nr:uncharacterized protein C9374_013161 [Naegleria lovaniensis]XP_044551507.1 uncharacterized protein C9374_001109 [Naegleria lovaniensis]KAG2372797.1 hypothetical protein C9374_013161 [Naegleria lovaniensis]KAG2387515.1 hypothetical protein C9374_001109 [Naegleria lovaniensis]